MNCFFFPPAAPLQRIFRLPKKLMELVEYTFYGLLGFSQLLSGTFFSYFLTGRGSCLGALEVFLIL